MEKWVQPIMNAATYNWWCGLVPGVAIGFCVGWGIAQREIAFLQAKMVELLDLFGRTIETLATG